MAYKVPKKIFDCMKELGVKYKQDQQLLLHKIVCDCYIYIEENAQVSHPGKDQYPYTPFDFDFSTTRFHNLTLFLSKDILLEIRDAGYKGSVSDLHRSSIPHKLLKDINECGNFVFFYEEEIGDLKIELIDEDDKNYKKSKHVLQEPNNHKALPKKIDNPNDIAKILRPDDHIWNPDYIRVFISYRGTHTDKALKLFEDLKKHGISPFLACAGIELAKEFQDEIIKRLRSMQIFLALITDDFADSVWTNQEIGFAKACNIPIVSILLGSKTPPGFIQGIHARKVDLNDSLEVEKLIKDIKDICKKPGREYPALSQTANVSSDSMAH